MKIHDHLCWGVNSHLTAERGILASIDICVCVNWYGVCLDCLIITPLMATLARGGLQFKVLYLHGLLFLLGHACMHALEAVLSVQCVLHIYRMFMYTLIRIQSLSFDEHILKYTLSLYVLGKRAIFWRLTTEKSIISNVCVTLISQ